MLFRSGLHPLCGIYTKAALPVLDRCLTEGILQVRRALSMMNAQVLDTAESPFPPEVFLNINTPEELEKASR